MKLIWDPNFSGFIHWWCSLTGNHKRLVLLTKCILWLIHYFIEGEQDREVQLYKTLGLYCMFNCCCMFFNIEDLREEWVLNPSCTKCQVCPYKTIKKMNLLYSSSKFSPMSHWWELNFWLNILLKNLLRYQITVSFLHCVQ